MHCLMGMFFFPCSKCGTFPPESCFFSLICSLGSFMGEFWLLRDVGGGRVTVLAV